ncbi:ABC transporter [Planotetraspora mira]|uniref:ABC transporter n=1 Tax=Planotetraspora mira TaxID=58121 RepID=A0A8J3TK87_9ACTN|nr:ABC transporter [Planotetraspora mira]
MVAEAPGSPAADASAPRRAVLALARVEMVRMLRHPVTVAATLLLAGLWVSDWFTTKTTRYPVLQELDHDSAMGMMILLGGAALIVGNLAVLRAHRDGTTGLSRVLILPDHARTLAHLLAPLPLAVVGAVLILARMAVLAICAPAAGHPNPYELAVGPATVLLLGALGVLLGRLTRSAVVAPLALLVLLAGLVFLEPLTNGGKALWLAPQGQPTPMMPIPVSLLARPAAAHLGYLLGLAGLLATAAVLRAGARGVRVAGAGAVALACTVAGGTAQLSPPSPAVTAARIAVMNQPSQHETCQELGHVTYCAFAEFSRWIPAWNTVVQAVVARVPATARSTQLTVRQRIAIPAFDRGTGPEQLLAAWRADDAAAGTPGAIGIDTSWGDSPAAANLAGQVAYRLVTGQTGEAPIEQRDGATACGGAGVLVVWLAGQASTHAGTGLGLLAEDARDERGGVSFYETQRFPTVYVPTPELTVATQALARPRADIAARVQQSWATLTAPGTTAAQAAQILGVPAPATSTAC